MIEPELKVGHFFLRVTLPILIMIAAGIYLLHAAVFGFWPFPPLQKNTELPNFTPRPNVSAIDTSNWQTFHSNKYGFQIKLPPNWLVTSEDVGEGFSSPEYAAKMNQNIENCNSNNTETTCITDPVYGVYGSEINFHPESESMSKTQSSLLINGMEFTAYSSHLNDETHYEIKYLGQVYDFSTVNQKPILEAILSTLKITR